MNMPPESPPGGWERQGLSREEPPPVSNDRASIQSLVMEDLRQREIHGIEKYGTPLQAFNGRDPLTDAYQELLDLVCYLRQRIEEERDARE